MNLPLKIETLTVIDEDTGVHLYHSSVYEGNVSPLLTSYYSNSSRRLREPKGLEFSEKVRILGQDDDIKSGVGLWMKKVESQGLIEVSKEKT